jgi:hypothetical protein
MERIRSGDDTLRSAYTQGVRNAINVVEPTRYQRDLEDAAIVEPGGAQPLVIRGADARGVAADLDDVIEHGAILNA